MRRFPLVLGLVGFAGASMAFASRMWEWVLNFDPGFEFSLPSIPTGTPSSAGVTILLVDGLRLDASRGMPALNALRARGADIEARVGTPSFSRPGRATVAVGAPPSIHGVTTNRQKRAVSLDNIIRRVGEAGGHCRVAGSKIWPGLFAKDILRCGVYRDREGKEGPGAFVRQVREIREAQEEGVRFVLGQGAMLRIADIISTDFAAHEYGGASPEYLAEVQRADAILAGLVARLDLSRETLIVTADHGHRDAGGHGGEEAEVLAIPIVLVGAGIRAGVTAKADQWDIAPTVAALLGLGLPTASAGRPLESVMVLDENRRRLLTNATALQRDRFERAVAGRLDVSVGKAVQNWTAFLIRHRDKESRGRLALLTFGLIFVPALALIAVRASQTRWAPLFAGALAAIIALLGPVRSQIPALSFSAINYDEMLIPFFEQILALATVTTLVALASTVLAARVFKRSETADPSFELVGSIGLLMSAALAAALGVFWQRFDLLSPLTLPGPDRLVEAFSLTLALLSTSATTLVALVVLRAIEAAKSRGGRSTS